jgi:hypothetical protein
MEPKQYVFRYSAGMVGTDMIILVPVQPFQTEQTICDEYRQEAEDWFWQFNDGKDFEEFEPELDYWVEEYNPDEHDGLLN